MAVEVVELLSAVLQCSPSNRTGMLQINGERAWLLNPAPLNPNP